MYSKLKKEIRECIEEALTKLRVKIDEDGKLITYSWSEKDVPEGFGIEYLSNGDTIEAIDEGEVTVNGLDAWKDAEEIKNNIKLPLYFEKVETKGPYINFFINYKLFSTLNFQLIC